MRKVCIGISVQEDPQRLRLTLDSVRRNTSQSVQIVLLPDDPDESASAYISNLNLPIVTGGDGAGAAACFNRLVTHADAEVYVFLEGGTRVGPRWLGHLLRGLDADPRNGLAGPSTNISWNEQGAFPRRGGSEADIERTARAAQAKFGDQVLTLEPLFSLADFCYAVRREVVAAIGSADERYSTGPCWEMDYNIRAARAGWRGVWVGAAYVHRTPFSLRRQNEEAQRFDTSKQLYQDKFCGARLRGEKSDYRLHCRGDACENFAPVKLIEIHRPLPDAKTISVAQPPVLTSDVGEPATLLATVQAPLVTCIMPTFNRRTFVPQAIRCFSRQDYQNAELLVVDDGTDSVADCVPESDRIRYLRLPRRLTIGAKRNLACEHARGEFIVHWDDDDWYPANRISRQIEALHHHNADLSGSSRIYYYDLSCGQAWEYRYTHANWVGGNTLAYRKSLWARHRFPDVQVGEDSRFVWSIGRPIADLADPALCIATVHAENTSRKDLRGSFWHPQPPEKITRLLGDDIYFYLRASREWPLVSCIMPTYNRRRYLPQALEAFRQQDYPLRELIVVDDGSDKIGDLLRGAPDVQYLRLSRRMSIGAKRNLACQHARGEIIAHWDDDDWYSPDRLRYQVAPIVFGVADLTGLENKFVLELPVGEFWTNDPRLHERMFVENVHGGTLVYRKQVWAEGLRYPETNLAEDAWLLYRATRSGKRLRRLSNPGVFVYVRHGKNAWREFAPGTFIDPNGWQRIPQPAHFPSQAFAFYLAANRKSSAVVPNQ